MAGRPGNGAPLQSETERSMDPLTPETGNEETQNTNPTPEEPKAPDYSILADLGDPEAIRKQLAHAREWEKRAKANHEAAKKLEALESERMTETEKAVAEAEKRGRDAAAAVFTKQLAEAKLRAAATGKVADVDALVDIVDLGKFVTPEGVDEEAINAAVERFQKAAPAPTQPKFGKVEMGPQGDRPRQLSEADLARMTPEEIVEARRKGHLDEVLGVTN